MFESIKKLPPISRMVKLVEFVLSQLHLIVARLDKLDSVTNSLKDSSTELKDSLKEIGNGQALSSQHIFDTFDTVIQSIDGLRRGQSELRAEFEKQSYVTISTSHYGLLNPEAGLMAHLRSFLPSRVAIDIGAHKGKVSERLLRAGYEVYAFEPYPPLFAKLKERLRDNSDFHPSDVAIGFVDQPVMDFHIAGGTPGPGYEQDLSLYGSVVQHSLHEGISFVETIQVSVRSLESLRRCGEIPETVGLLKVDTEGNDLEVIRGMGDWHPSVIAAEFWDTDHSFAESGAFTRLDALVGEMRQRCYQWHIVVYRAAHTGMLSFYCNESVSMPGSWGNVFFFGDYDVFAEARDWCSAVLRPTYFLR
jgi:FkbM family methyltransferase